MPASAAFPLALLRLDGVGRVTAHRVLDHFDSPEALRQTPREQILLRLKSAPRASATVDQLLGDALDEAVADAEKQMEALAPKGVTILTRGADGWPTRLDDLAPSDRPVAIWVYGHTDALAPGLALLGRAGLDVPAFEAATTLASGLAPGGLATLVKDGFDLAVQKPAMGAGGRIAAVAACGLARLEPSLRPGATMVVKRGGCLVSPWPMPHGPFDHDAREAALVCAALAGAVVGAGVTDSDPEARALAWSVDHRPTFALGSGPEGVPVREPADIAALLAP